MKKIGSVEVVLYAGLRGAEPIEVGTMLMPLTLRDAANGRIEGRLKDAVEYTVASFEHVFSNDEEEENRT
jgi:hypothetical protein